MKYCLPHIVVLFIAFKFYAQSEFGFKAGGGLSQIQLESDWAYKKSIPGLGFTKYGALGWRLHLTKRKCLGMELMLSNVTGKEEMIFDMSRDSKVLYGHVYTSYQIVYWALPIYYGFNFHKNFMMTLGLHPAYAKSEHLEQQSDQISLLPFRLGSVYDKLDLGSRISLEYKFLNCLILESTYIYGLPTLHHRELNWKIQQFTFGLRYTFHPKYFKRKQA